uniref:Uncharacterized protein n=1 Tax=Ciona intestinalis TaxID=7719 RepID=H2Y0U5_CIOIN
MRQLKHGSTRCPIILTGQGRARLERNAGITNKLFGLKHTKLDVQPAFASIKPFMYVGVNGTPFHYIFSSHLVVNKEYSKNYKTISSRLPQTVVMIV